jgi:WD40 repeat protein
MDAVLRSRIVAGTAAFVVVLTGAACGSSSEPSPKPTTGGLPSSATSSATDSQQGVVKQLWAQTWTSEGQGPPDAASAVAVSPGGSTVFVTGSGPTVAYAAATGKQRWLAIDPTFARGASSMAVRPDGATVFITGTTRRSGSAEDYLTVAYDAATGTRLWSARYNGPSNGMDNAASVVASDTMVIVNGSSTGVGTGTDFATVAYDATTGKQRWVARYDGPGHGVEAWFPSGVHSLAVDPKGETAFVTGGSQGAGSKADYATVAYDAATGIRRWVARYDDPSSMQDLAAAVAVSPDGSTVVATGSSEAAATKSDIATVAYNAATGKQLWVKRYNGAANQNEGGGAVVFGPDGPKVFITGTSEGATPGHEDFATVAYNSATGALLWTKRYDGPTGGDDNAYDLAASPDGSVLVVTGRSVPAPMKDVYATVGYGTGSGEQLWTQAYGVTGSPTDGNLSSEAHAVAVSPKDGTVFVTGVSGRGYATVAYRS